MLDGVCTLSSWRSLDIAKCDEAKFRGFPTVPLQASDALVLRGGWRRDFRGRLTEHVGLDEGHG